MAIMAAATVATVVARPLSLTLVSRRRSRWGFSPLAYSSSSSSSSSSTRKLVLYSKSGCCLCDGLKEKLQAAFLLSGPDSLHDVDLQVRDITTNPEWEKSYQYEIPVLARVLSDGTEVLMAWINRFRIEAWLSQMSLDCVMAYQQLSFLNIVEALPRLSPRIGVELIQKKIAAALRQ
ncbi:hypothetical protein CUMW_061950 [Citrus unshiu]|uniref:Glutaredoxin-like protein n=1 Tax=Citrus unshiu TaxID=55188 RepID=A0A2H5NNM6_CITUN|nr:hypothetical protein CUMW_061950 [Citrus unshiu]